MLLTILRKLFFSTHPFISRIKNNFTASPLYRENSNEDNKQQQFLSSTLNSTKIYSNESNFNGQVMNSINLINKLMKKDGGQQSPASNSSLSFSPNNFKGELKQIKLVSTPADNSSPPVIMPSKETVIRKMKRITKIIQDLYKAIKEFKYDRWVEWRE